MDQGKKPIGDKNALLAGNKLGGMHNMFVYSGKKTPLIQQPTSSHTTNVVLSLPEYLKGKVMTCTLTSCIQHTTSL